MKLIEVIADPGSLDTVAAIAEKHQAHDFRPGLTGEDGLQVMRMTVADEQMQAVLDSLQHSLGAQERARVTVLAVEVALPKPAPDEGGQRRSATAAREALYESVARGIHLDVNFAVLVALSTVVAAIGLIEDNVAVVIGAMVIAPLLGPNLAFGLGTALGDTALMRRAVVTLAAGLGLAILLSVGIGFAWPFTLESPELMGRTDVGMDSLALALASGAAAALSLTTGLPSVLVGVMVAVALLPPAATVGLMLGKGHLGLAGGAGLLLLANVVCVNLASKLVFLVKGVEPRTWYEKEKARRAMTVYLLAWAVTLVLLVLAILGRRELLP